MLRRYKRFLADIRLEDGREVTAHLANPGSMMGLKEPGLRVWLEPNDDPRRKLGFTWRLVEFDDAWVGIDTSVPNRVVGEALRAGRVPGMEVYNEVLAEQRYGANSRIDFLCRGEGVADTYLEVKNVHLVRTPGLAEFPDSVTARGAKHLAELAAMVRSGHRAVMLYCVQRTDCTRLAFARDLDPAYAAAFAEARAAGVEALAMTCRVGREEIVLDRPVPIGD
ncbi:MAG: DNA/RNA nuclease SfsA [Pseudomonadota bacterium]